MKIGVPREAKEGERRVAFAPAHVASLVADGHEVVVEARAGAGVGFDDAAYRNAGARIGDAWEAPLIVKVKELHEADFTHLGARHTVFSFQHLPGEPQRTRRLAASGATAIAFEMVRDAAGGYPLLAPMSVIAGRLAVEMAARHRGRAPKRVLVLGGGNAGEAAAQAARSLGAIVDVLGRATATPENIERLALHADVVVGAVFVAGEATPKLLPRALVKRMKRGAMIVDISIDAGGVAETSRHTTHAEPTFVEEGVIHYGVANMPAAMPREAALALGEAVLPYARELAAKGVARAILENAALRAGVLVWKGRLNHRGIAEEAGVPYTPLSDADLA